MRQSRCVAILSAALVCGSSLAAPAVDLLPHRAFYDVRLKDSTWGSNVQTLNGALVVEFNDSCDGYTLNQRFVTEMGDSDGNVVVSDLWMTSWEAADGKTFRFNLKSEVDGNVVQSVKGRAVSGGNVDYEGGQAKASVALPQGTQFPTAHARDLILVAQKGDPSLSRTIFDGSAEGEIYSSFATIGKERPRETTRQKLGAVDGAKSLTDLRAWPVTLSYYLMESQEATPEYEVSFIMYENGMSSDLVMDYGDFSVTATLTKIEPIEKPRC